MKKVFLFLAAALLSLSMQAKVGFVVPATNSASTNRSDIPLQYSNKGGVDHTPEKMAYDWFKTEYVDKGEGDFLSINDLATVSRSTYSTIWIYVDRELKNWNTDNGKFDTGSFDALFSSSISGLTSYVQDGGCLFLCKQATRLVNKIGRIDYEPIFENGGYSDADRIDGIKGLIGSSLDGIQQSDRRSHAIYQYLSHGTMGDLSYPLLTVDGDDIFTWNAAGFVEYYSYDKDCGGSLCKRHKNGDNGVANDAINSKNLIDWWEYYWKAEALGVRNDIGDYCFFMAAEFKPGYTKCGAKSEYKGTIITMGSAAYQWGDNKGVGLENLKKLTSNSLSYLESFNEPEKVANPAAATAFLLMAADVASLPSVPEKNAANEFAKTYFAETEQASQGRYISLSELSSIPASVKTIIIHADRTELFDWSSYTETLKTWVKNGGNLVLLRQATVLASEMGRIDYAPHCQALSKTPTMDELDGGNLGEAGNNQYDKIRVKIGIDGISECGTYDPCSVDRSGDDLFAGMTKIVDGNNVTITLNTDGSARNRCYWQEIKGNNAESATYSRVKFEEFQTRYHCEVLAVEGYVKDFCLASIIRFGRGTVPADSNANWKGSILAIGAGGFQYTDGNKGNFGLMNTLVESAVESIKTAQCDNCFLITF